MASVLIALAAILLIAAYLHSVFAGDLILFSVLDEFRLSRLDLAAADAAWASNPRRSDVVVSLPTLPSPLPPTAAAAPPPTAGPRRPPPVREDSLPQKG